MRAYKLALGTLFLILCLAGAVSAQEIGTSQENACNEGGILFRDGVSLCETEWHWECGWYIANWQNTGESVPDWCGTGHLAGSTVSAPPAAYIGCVYYQVLGPGSYSFLNFGYQTLLPAGVVGYYSHLYNSSTCSAPSAVTSFPVIYALSEAEALSRCITEVGGVSVSNENYSNVYNCHLS